MNLSKLKFALVGAMIIGIFSLNFTNPFAMSNNEFDSKGVANEISTSITSTQTDEAVISAPIVLTTLLYVTYKVTKKIACSGEASTGTIAFDGAAKVSADRLAMNRLD